jgi:hypothetical protein
MSGINGIVYDNGGVIVLIFKILYCSAIYRELFFLIMKNVLTQLILHDVNMETLGNGKLLVYLDVNMYTSYRYGTEHCYVIV